MDSLSNLSSILGEENERKIKDGITNLIIQSVEDDLSTMGTYIIDYEDLFDRMRDEVEPEIMRIMAKRYMNKMKVMMDDLFNDNNDNKDIEQNDVYDVNNALKEYRELIKEYEDNGYTFHISYKVEDIIRKLGK